MGNNDRNRPSCFFLRFLTYQTDPEEIKNLVKSMNRASWEINQQLYGICYHMSGMGWQDALLLSSKERDGMIKYINKMIEQQNEAYGG